MKKIYIIGIGGIGISALARYYNNLGYKVFGSDSTHSSLINKLLSEGIDIKIGTDITRIDGSFEQVVYTEAINPKHPELIEAQNLDIQTLSYPEAIGKISEKNKLIAIAGTHGKSTTTSMLGIILKNTDTDYTAIVGTLLQEFGGRNFFHRDESNGEDYFLIEACEYKRSFLHYKPYILAITNIEVDHLDYYKDETDYISAYVSIINNVKTNGYVILNKQESNSRSLIGMRDDINYIEVDDMRYTLNGKSYKIPNMNLQIAGDHIHYDAKIAYIAAKLIGINKNDIIDSLESYSGAWRRMEKIGYTEQKNLIISDYGHHPTEIYKTLASIKKTYSNKKLITIFQPHQYSRTIELLDDFKNCFIDTDILIIPNIYESRDSQKDKDNMNTQKLVKSINHEHVYDGKGFQNTLALLKSLEKKFNDGDCIILLLGAGDVDNLRNDLV